MFQIVPSSDPNLTPNLTTELDGSTPGQHAAIAALLQTTSIARAAEQAGVGRTTLHRWFKEPVFSRVLRDTRRSAARAVETLTKVMDDEKASPSSKVSASRTMLNLTYNVLEVDDVEDRLTALEGARFERPPRLPTEL